MPDIIAGAYAKIGHDVMYGPKKEVEEPGKAMEYMQQKNNSIRNYLGSLRTDYASRMSMPSKNGSMNSRLKDRANQQDLYKPQSERKPILDRKLDDYIRRVA